MVSIDKAGSAVKNRHFGEKFFNDRKMEGEMLITEVFRTNLVSLHSFNNYDANPKSCENYCAFGLVEPLPADHKDDIIARL